MHESQIQPVIYCAKENGMQIRVRSGGHDYEGHSYASKVPFVILDLFNLRKISVDAENKTAWVQADLFIRILIRRVNSSEDTKRTIQATFQSLFLGGVNRLLPLMQQSFPELGLQREDCTEMSWIESILYFAGTQPNVRYFKAKSDYVQKPISKNGLEGIWKLFFEEEAEKDEMILSPYGGRMDGISESAIPIPHRAGNLYKIQHLVYWEDEEVEATQNYINWIRKLFRYMAPYVSGFPRAAYINYRDLDIGVNNNGNTSYAQASVWGIKYFKNNFNRLVQVKTKVDPTNFFRNEQSIPPLNSWWNKNGK
ncbi:FAD-binding Berberine family protein [Forsythia ovata]|uniref:FAD-binding Berberine family protein n=1 Tax=Forsythia ovata TaxID=205694 RepID=A0ABD1S126_9LAMI